MWTRRQVLDHTQPETSNNSLSLKPMFRYTVLFQRVNSSLQSADSESEFSSLRDESFSFLNSVTSYFIERSRLLMKAGKSSTSSYCFSSSADEDLNDSASMLSRRISNVGLADGGRGLSDIDAQELVSIASDMASVSIDLRLLSTSWFSKRIRSSVSIIDNPPVPNRIEDAVDRTNTIWRRSGLMLGRYRTS